MGLFGPDGPFRGGGMQEGRTNGNTPKSPVPPWVVLLMLAWLAVCAMDWWLG